MDPILYENRPKRWEDGPVADGGTLDLFAPAPIVHVPAPVVATADHETSRDAADAVTPAAKRLRAEVYRLFVLSRAGWTDKELEQRPEWAQYGPSTVRKRRSELKKQGYLVDSGERRDGCIVWALPPGSR
jgi:hypothetical protein